MHDKSPHQNTRFDPDISNRPHSAVMVLNPADPKPIILNDDNDDEVPTVYGVTSTPPETVAADLEDHDSFSNTSPFRVPWPGSTFIIRSLSSGKFLTLLDGNIMLTGGRGSIEWACVENNGWLGFRNIVSGKFLGHDKKGELCCFAERHRMWELFCVRMRPEGGCVLLLTHWNSLWHVGIREEQGVEKLAKIGAGGCGGMVWEFIPI